MEGDPNHCLGKPAEELVEEPAEEPVKKKARSGRSGKSNWPTRSKLECSGSRSPRKETMEAETQTPIWARKIREMSLDEACAED